MYSPSDVSEMRKIEQGKDYTVYQVIGKDNEILGKMMASPEANYLFDYRTGEMVTWGITMDTDAVKFPGPNILDMEITTICKHGCPFCVPGDTLIMTPEGQKPITELKIGDQVKSWNPQTHRLRTNVIKELYNRNYQGVLVTIELENGQKVKMTANHPVYVKSLGWIEAKDLTADMEVITI